MSNSENVFTRRDGLRRVVVTGLGSVNPLANNVVESWEKVINGHSGIATVTQFNASGYPVTFAGEVKNLDLDKYVIRKQQKKMDRFIHFAMAATKMALDDSGLEINDFAKQNTGVIIGVGMGGLSTIEKQYETLLNRGPAKLSPFFIPSVITNLASGQVSIEYGLQGPNYTVSSACASAIHSIGDSLRFIRQKHCKIMISGGAESTICPLGLGGFAAMKALSSRNNQPELASRPWDKDRDGFVLGEGSGILILEDYEHACQRGARIYGEISGYGLTADAHHMTNPSPGGDGPARSMNMALEDAKILPEQIDYINAHGTSTPAGDLAETQAIKLSFKKEASKVCISSTKSMTGHLLGAAGALESIFCLKALESSIVPPTINLDSPSEDCDLDYIPCTARDKKLTHVLNNSFGFGGTNASLIFSKI